MPKKIIQKNKTVNTIKIKQQSEEVTQGFARQYDEDYKQNEQHANLFDEAILDIQIDEVAEVPAHRFAQKRNMKSKQSEEEKDRMVEEDPFAMVANCSRFTASKEMKVVKDSLSKIDALMVGNIPTEKSQFLKEQTVRVAAYNEVIASCNSYIQTKDPSTANGKRRLKMVQGIKAKCEQELTVFESVSTSMYEDVVEGEQKNWLSVLSEIRTESINMNEPDRTVVKAGAGTSEVLICNIEDKKYYFKKNEVFENISTTDLAHREMKTADPQSIAGKINAKLIENPDLKWSFDDMLDTLVQDEEIFTKEITEESVQNIRSVLTKYMSNNADFINALCDTVEHTKQFMDYFSELKKHYTKCNICERAKIKEGAVLSSHNVATSRVANLLGVSNLVASSKNVNLTYQENTFKGNMMDEAPGEVYGTVLNEAYEKNIEVKLSPEAISQIQTMQVLDYLCGQVDRNKGNFMCIVDKTKSPWIVSKITAIDNDISFGELDLNVLKGKRVQELPRMIDRNGVFSIAALDAEFVTNFMSLTPELLKFALKDLLNEGALNALATRLETLQDVIKTAIQNKQTKVLDKNNPAGWEEAHNARPSKYAVVGA